MNLSEHGGAASLEKRLERLVDVPRSAARYANDVPAQAERLRSKFRKALRDAADHKEEFSSTKNGTGSFRDWSAGFKFAASVGGADVFYHRAPGSTITAFFHLGASLSALNAILDKYAAQALELEKLLAVSQVMTT